MTDPRLPFVDLMAIAAVGKNGPRFISKNPGFNPGGGAAFGGYVYAQSVWAASHTVDKGMVVHNVHGYFTLPGLTDRPFIYKISHLSEGRSYCTRSVTVRQPTVASSPSAFPTEPWDLRDAEKELGKIVFACLCSFKRDESVGTKHQAIVNLEEVYGDVIKGKRPEDHSAQPRIDAPWWYRYSAEYPQRNDFPGLDMRKVDMTAFNKSKSALDYRQLSYYQPIGSIPLTDLNLHACAHLFASDRNSVFVVSQATGFGDQVGAMGSLSHSVVFHVSSKDLVLKDGEWWIQEAWTPRSEGGRGIHQSRIWDESGTHIASTWQDGLARGADKEQDQKQKKLWFEGMESAGRLYKDETNDLGRPKL